MESDINQFLPHSFDDNYLHGHNLMQGGLCERMDFKNKGQSLPYITNETLKINNLIQHFNNTSESTHLEASC